MCFSFGRIKEKLTSKCFQLSENNNFSRKCDNGRENEDYEGFFIYHIRMKRKRFKQTTKIFLNVSQSMILVSLQA